MLLTQGKILKRLSVIGTAWIAKFPACIASGPLSSFAMPMRQLEPLPLSTLEISRRASVKRRQSPLNRSWPNKTCGCLPHLRNFKTGKAIHGLIPAVPGAESTTWHCPDAGKVIFVEPGLVQTLILRSCVKTMQQLALRSNSFPLGWRPRSEESTRP